MKLKKRTTTHTEMQTATFTGIPPGSLQLQPRDHFAIWARLRPWNESHIHIGTLVPPAASSSGDLGFPTMEIKLDQPHRAEGRHFQTAWSESFPRLVDSLVSNGAQEMPPLMLAL